MDERIWLLKELKKRAGQEWLVGYDSFQFYGMTEEFLREFSQLDRGKRSPNILLAEANPFKFLAAFMAGVVANCNVFLGNYNWSQEEWQQVFDSVQPDLIVGDCPNGLYFSQRIRELASSLAEDINLNNFGSLLMIPTGGTSGNIRFAIHNWKTLSASVAGFYRYFNEKSVNSFCVLPVDHVSGLMQFIRSFLTGGRLVILPYKALKKGFRGQINSREFFISLVPTQMQFLLDSDPSWLSGFHTVLLGGAPPWPSLLNTARKHRIRLSLTYGMTETASQIVTLKPEDFLNGNNSSGQVLPHAKVTIDSYMGELINSQPSGIIKIQADSLFLGYYPKLCSNLVTFSTDDLGFFDKRGYLNIVGRCSHKIITGGENVFPTEVEAAILATDLVKDICILGLPDRHWGEAVTAVYVPKTLDISLEEIKSLLQDKLSKFKHPKYWVKSDKLPRNLRGKVNRQEILNIALEKLSQLISSDVTKAKF